MTIEEAIGVQLEIAKAREEFAEKHQNGEDASTAKVAKRIASEHRQIAQWLGELVRLRKIRPIVEKIALEKIGSELDILDGKDTNVPSKEIIYCMDCKYFCKKSGFCTLGTGRFVYEEDFCSQAEKRGDSDADNN